LPYLVHSDEDRASMLAAIGVESMDDLLVDIPQSLRIKSLELPSGLSEYETISQIASLAARNRVFPDRLTFRGGGVYRRFIPAAVAAVTSKPEFYTAYTPYQPEASQGTLQAIFEFQTLIAELTALDVANASLYDGATAVAEAAMMAHTHTGRNEVVVAGYLHPEYVEVLRAFGDGRGIKVRKGTEPGPKTAAVIFQQPDFLGLLVDAKALTESAHAAGALAIACVDPISLSILAPPGEYGADIAVGEGQQLGLSPSYGGPHVGFISCRKELVRRLPGRLIGTAHDGQGRRGFVLTLSAREQHIRREKATSNICTNHSLCALAASVYMTYMGPDGLRQVAEVSFKRAHGLAERLAALPGWEPAFPDRQFFNEFPMRVPKAPALVRKLARKGILGPLEMNRWFRELKGVVTFTCTEVNDLRAIDELVELVAALQS
jgi:glycine dehydrogenase subunit 1